MDTDNLTGITPANRTSERQPQQQAAPSEPALHRAHRHLRVPVSPAEEALIKQLAKATGLSVAAYLRSLGLGKQLRGIVDHQRVEELARINGELERLARLLRLWLEDDLRTAAFGADTLRAVLARIDETQREMQIVMRHVVLPGAKHVPFSS